MEGNPVFDEVDYKTVALAYLKHLKYLDYKLVDPEEVTHSREACQDDLMELEDNEALEAAAQEREAIRLAHSNKLAEANLTVTETLFSAMLKDDIAQPSLQIVARSPGPLTPISLLPHAGSHWRNSGYTIFCSGLATAAFRAPQNTTAAERTEIIEARMVTAICLVVETYGPEPNSVTRV